MAEHAPRAEALAASSIQLVRPAFLVVYRLRRRLATIAVGLLTLLLFMHVVLGANGMVVYKQKKTEYQSLQRRVIQMQQENDQYTRQIQALKTDQSAIEKEAREQLGYAKPGEYVYVPPTSPKPQVPGNHSAKK
jgi:cell division protein FtsB